MNLHDHELLLEAQALDRSGKTLEAAIAYRAFLDREPGHADVWADYGGKLLILDRAKEAEEACHRALALHPSNAPAQINLGSLLLRQGRQEEAESQFRSVLVSNPKRMDARLFLAQCLLQLPDLEKACLVLEEANRLWGVDDAYAPLRPHFAELWARYGTSLQTHGAFEEAQEAYASAQQLDPQNFRAKANLGSLHMAMGHLEEAEAQLGRLAAALPENESARLLWITCLTRMGDAARALPEIARVLQQAPRSFLVHKSVMGPYYSLGCWTEYRAEIERFRQVDPTSAYVDYEESFVDLLFGDMRRGWGLFEARLKVAEGLRPQRTFAEPTWNGQSFTGKTLLVWVEQGLGDTLMFVRYLRLVKALGGLVILEAQPDLVALVTTCEGIDLVVPTGTSLPNFDLQVSLMSLPWLFRTELASIPDEVPYLRIPGTVPHESSLRELLAQSHERTRIGLVWAGSPNHARDNERSLPASALAPLGALSGVTWFSFQVGRPDSPPLPNLVSLEPHLQTFSDTAFAMKAMDLLITVDTSVAHLAGAMGIPTLLLLAFQPDYRWMLERTDTPWYPTLRLYRQPTYGAWASVLQQVVADLSQASPGQPPHQRELAP